MRGGEGRGKRGEREGDTQDIPGRGKQVIEQGRSNLSLVEADQTNKSKVLFINFKP